MAKSKAKKKDKNTSFLNQDVDLKNFSLKNLKSPSVPTKDTMNLFVKVKTDNSPSRVIPWAIVLLILIVLFCKFAVFDRLADLNEAEANLASAQTLYDNCQSELRDYPVVKEKYYRYTDEYKTDEEASLIDRATIIDIIDNASAGLGTVRSFNVSGNRVSGEVIASNLDQVSLFRQRLEAYDMVDNVSVYTANKNGSDGVYCVASVVFDVIEAQETVSDPSKVVIEKKPSELKAESPDAGDEAYENKDRTGGEQ